MFKKFSLIAAFVLIPFVALADKITVYNNTDSTIFKLFAWPDDLHPRSFNLLGFPLFPASKTDLDVDNAYGDCAFIFQYDVNNPAKRNVMKFKKKPLEQLYANICAKDPFIWLGHLPYGKTQGHP